MIDTVLIQPGKETGEPSVAGISWAAVAAGAVVSCALTLVVLAFGIGLGLSVVSPWSGSCVSATTFKIGTGLYLVVIAMLSLSIGGYMAGRLRSRWIGVHGDEVLFRDTAHGFIAWAFATAFLEPFCWRRSPQIFWAPPPLALRKAQFHPQVRNRWTGISIRLCALTRPPRKIPVRIPAMHRTRAAK